MQKTKAFLFVVVLAWLGSCETCGGNCPQGNCPSCICGTSKSTISLQEYCSASIWWNQACCKCIASSLSGGNANYMYYKSSAEKEVYYYAMGVMKLIGKSNSSSYHVDCPVSSEQDMCDPLKNAQCADRIYVRFGWQFMRWYDAAESCGCLPSQTQLLVDDAQK